MGRRSEFDQGTADTICELLESGKSLNAACVPDEMPSAATVLRWVKASPEFAKQYAHARELGYQLLADAILDISDEENTTVRRSKHPTVGCDEDGEDLDVVFDATAVARNRLRVDSRKWMLSKMLPKVYGDKVQQVHTGGIEVKLIERRIIDAQS